MMSNAAAAAVSMRFKLLGPCHGIVSACSGGADAIGAAKMMIESGLVDAVVTGGSEAALTPLANAAFGALDALSAKGISRPFDKPTVTASSWVRAPRSSCSRRRERGDARGQDPRHAEGLRRFGRRVPPDRARQGRAADRRAAIRRPHRRTPASRPRTSSTSTPTAPRPVSTTRAETKALKIGAGRPRARDPGLVD